MLLEWMKHVNSKWYLRKERLNTSRLWLLILCVNGIWKTCQSKLSSRAKAWSIHTTTKHTWHCESQNLHLFQSFERSSAVLYQLFYMGYTWFHLTEAWLDRLDIHVALMFCWWFKTLSGFLAQSQTRIGSMKAPLWSLHSYCRRMSGCIEWYQ